jgi:hypothetical protein
MLPRQCQGVNAEANCSGSLSLSTQQRKRNACCCMLHAGSTGNWEPQQQPAASSHCALRTAARHACLAGAGRGPGSEQQHLRSACWARGPTQPTCLAGRPHDTRIDFLDLVGENSVRRCCSVVRVLRSIRSIRLAARSQECSTKGFSLLSSPWFYLLTQHAAARSSLFQPPHPAPCSTHDQSAPRS